MNVFQKKYMVLTFLCLLFSLHAYAGSTKEEYPIFPHDVSTYFIVHEAFDAAVEYYERESADWNGLQKVNFWNNLTNRIQECECAGEARFVLSQCDRRLTYVSFQIASDDIKAVATTRKDDEVQALVECQRCLEARRDLYFSIGFGARNYLGFVAAVTSLLKEEKSVEVGDCDRLHKL